MRKPARRVLVRALNLRGKVVERLHARRDDAFVPRPIIGDHGIGSIQASRRGLDRVRSLQPPLTTYQGGFARNRLT